MPRQDDWKKTPEPCIYLSTRRQTYMVKLFVTSPKTGKRVKREVTDLPTLAEAVTTRERVRAEIKGEQAPTPLRPTLASYSVGWFRRRKAWLAPGTVQMYRRVLKRQILPTLGDIYCDAFQRSDFEDWVAWCERQRTGTGALPAQATMRSWRRVATPLLKDMAIDHGIPDPTLRVRQARSSRRRVREVRTLTVTELGALVVAARRLPKLRERYAEIVTLAFTGMRSGELWALHVEDLDEIEERGVHIHRSVSGGVIRSETKTGWERHAYAPPIVVEAIQEHRRIMVERQHRGLASGLVFPSQAGTARTSGSIRKALGMVATAAGIGQQVTPQVLRRTYNTALVEASVDHLVLRSQIGHSSDDMTRHYFEGHIEAKAAAFGRAFEVISGGGSST